MNNLFPFRLRFASERVHSVQPVRYKYFRFLNLEPTSDFHFLYLDIINLCRYNSLISISSNA